MFSAQVHVTSSRPKGQIQCDNIKLYTRHVFIMHAYCELTPEWVNVAQQHQVDKDRIKWAWPTLREKIVQCSRLEDHIGDEISCPWCTPGRHEAMASVKRMRRSHPRTRMLLSSCLAEPGILQRLCARQLGFRTESKFPQKLQMQWRPTWL